MVHAVTDVVEFLGNEELLHVSVGEHDLVAIVDASKRVRPGDVSTSGCQWRRSTCSTPRAACRW